MQVINCTIFFSKTAMAKEKMFYYAYKIRIENLIHVTVNWLVQGFAWYRIVEIIIAREKFIVYKNVM